LQQVLKPDLPNTKRFHKCNRKQLQNFSHLCFNEVQVKKLGYHTTENNDDSYYRTLMRALKTAQFAWIFVGNGSNAHKILWALPEFFF